MQQRGCFITFEGGEGSGKSTQINLLAEYLKQLGQDVVITREPGATKTGKQIRQLLVEGDKDKFDEITETLLFYADRRINLTQIILPALNQGKIVLSDRHNDSTVAYQYYGSKKFTDQSLMNTLYNIVSADTATPDLTFLLDISPKIGLERSYAKAATMQNKELRFENTDFSFHERLRQGYLTLAKQNPSRIKIIPAEGTAKQVFELVKQAYHTRFPLFPKEKTGF